MATYNFGGIGLVNDASGIKRADNKPWAGYYDPSTLTYNPNPSWGDISQQLHAGNFNVLGADLAPYGKEILGLNDQIASTENYDTGFGAGKWVPGAILGIGGGLALSELGAGSWFGDLFKDAPWGVNAAKDSAPFSVTGNIPGGADTMQSLWQAAQGTGGGMELPLVDDWSNWMSAGNLMPAAIPESPAQLAEWGLKETSPGFWEQPAIPGSAATAADWISKIASNPSTWGKLLATGLGAVGSSQQAKSLQELAQKYSDYGAPSRARFEAGMSPGFDPMSIPGYAGALDTASKGLLARLSATGGNPFGQPSGLIEANKAIVSGTALPAINEYLRLNANAGFGNSMNAAIPFETAAIGQQGNLLNSLGYGLQAATNPQPTLADMIKALQIGGLA